MTGWPKPKRPLSEPFRCPRLGGGFKDSFRSPAKARKAIRRHRQQHPRLFFYRCPLCQWWHITSQVPQNEGQP